MVLLLRRIPEDETDRTKFMRARLKLVQARRDARRKPVGCVAKGVIALQAMQAGTERIQMTSEPQADSGGVVKSTACSGRVLEPEEEVLQGDKILLVGNSWITAKKTEHVWRAKDYIEVRRPNVHVRFAALTGWETGQI